MNVNGYLQLSDTGSSNIIQTSSSQHQPQAAQIQDSGSSYTWQKRSRWNPTPEQTFILQTYFDEGVVNPGKEETLTIRKLLETFGPVGDASIYYWFQNRRSRTKRQLRKEADAQNAQNQNQYDPSSFFINFGDNSIVPNATGFEEMGYNGSQAIPPSFFCPPSDISGEVEAGFVKVLINGVPQELPKGPLDMMTMCGTDFVLVHSTGEAVQVNEYGFSAQGLQQGESYYLIAKSN